MATVEVDEAQANAWKAAHNLLDNLMRDPNIRPYQEKLIKHKFPKAVITEDDPRVKELRQVQAEMRNFKNERETEKIQARLDAGFERLRERDYTPEGIEKIKKLMIERNIPDPEDAAMVFEARNPPQNQNASLYGPQDWGLGQPTDDEDLKLMWKDEDAWLNREIGKVFSERNKRED